MENIVYSQKAIDKRNTTIVVEEVPKFSVTQLLVFKSDLEQNCEFLIEAANNLYKDFPNKELNDSIIILQSAQRSLNLIHIKQNE